MNDVIFDDTTMVLWSERQAEALEALACLDATWLRFLVAYQIKRALPDDDGIALLAAVSAHRQVMAADSEQRPFGLAGFRARYNQGNTEKA